MVEPLDSQILDATEPELHQLMVEGGGNVVGPLERVKTHVDASLMNGAKNHLIPIEAKRPYFRVVEPRPISECTQNLLVILDALVWRAHLAEHPCSLAPRQ